MENIENLSAEELNAQLESEIQALNGGINPSNTNETQEEVTEDETIEETQEEELEETSNEDLSDDEDKSEDKKESKTEKKIKKLLSQRNEAKKENETLSERLERLENQLADEKFYWENQDAIHYKDQIDELVKEKNLSRKEAYILSAWEQLLQKAKKSSANKPTIWITPTKSKEWVNPKDMNMNDLDNLIRQEFSAGNIKI